MLLLRKLPSITLQCSLDPSVEGRWGLGAVDRAAAAALQILCMFHAAKSCRTLVRLAWDVGRRELWDYRCAAHGFI
jgi:hypothetical protein